MVDPSMRRIHILIIEDHVDTAEMLTVILGSEGYEVSQAHSAAEALDVFRDAAPEQPESGPDLLLLDLMLPDMDGSRIVQALGRMLHRVPTVVVMSAKPLEAVKAEARAIGAAGLVRKPFEIETLLDTLRAAASGASASAS